MAIPDGALLQKIAEAMAVAAGTNWRKLSLSITGVAATWRTQLAIEGANGVVDVSKGLGDDAVEWCDDLRDGMYADGEGTWYNATITVTADGQVESTFDYDTPPFAGEVTDDLLLDVQEAYPRAADRLPVWHPSRTALA